MLLLAAANLPAQTPPKACRVGVIAGEVKAGEMFERRIGNGLAVVLDPLPSGWVLRVIPATGPRGQHDYAELATPPYESVNPLLVSTDFSFRAQDAVGWNPRRFRFATSAAAFARLNEAYQRYVGPGKHAFGKVAAEPSPAAEQAIAQQVGAAAEGELQIVDAGLIGGTADQWKTAATVATHFNSTAHVVEQPGAGGATPLGKLTWIRFRITLHLPAGFKPDPRMEIEPAKCGTD